MWEGGEYLWLETASRLPAPSLLNAYRYNSRLILAYCDLSPYVLRPLVHALKLWAGVNGLNDASGAHGPATLSSYCLTLMAIAYLQHRGHLPNLQAEVLAPIPDRLQDDARDVVWCSWGKPQATKAHVGFNRQPPPGWQPREPDLNAATALRGFFAFYSHGPSAPQGLSASPNRFDYDRQVISVLHGGVLPRAEFRGQEEGEGNITKLERFRREGIMGKGDLGIQPDIWKFRQVVVQDPFIWQKVSRLPGSRHCPLSLPRLPLTSLELLADPLSNR